MADLSGRTAFVTAGSRGIGRAICLKLAEAGADVGINYQSNHHAAAEVAAQIQAKGRRAATYQFGVADWAACQTGVTPKDGYFLLRKNHPNYNALYSLTLVAAVNRDVLQMRTRAEVTNQEYGEAAYMVVDW